MGIERLDAEQRAWLKANGVKAKHEKLYGLAGWWFYKGERFILPIGNGCAAYLMERDYHEDGDGEKCVAVFPNLKEALRVLAGLK